MRHLPRLAVGTIQPRACRKAAVWGLLAALAKIDASPILFRSSLEFAGQDPAPAITGRPSRHLDSWAMSRSDALSALSRATNQRDTALVEGVFEAGWQQVTTPASSLDRLCQWLDLPRIAVVDVQDLRAHGITRRPERIDALLLDRVSDVGNAAYWQTTLETLWKTPVIGWLDEAAPLRALTATLPPGVQPSRELCEALGSRVLPTLRLPRLKQIADRPVELDFEPEAWLHNCQNHFRIAVAMDEAFRGYYPETLDLLEEAGAELCDFSPLRSERIPDHVEIVYFGQADLDHDPERLAANHCLKQSLRGFAAEGGRVYAEGSGLAYLCREAQLANGRGVALTGLLPAIARSCRVTPASQPAETTFGIGSWLAPAQVSIRGYRDSTWHIESAGPVIPYAAGTTGDFDILGRGNVIGSRILINLAANRHLLRRFFEPYAPVLTTTRRATDL